MFVANDLMASLTLNVFGTVNYSGVIYPEIASICSNCGYTRRFNYNILMNNQPVG